MALKTKNFYFIFHIGYKNLNDINFENLFD